MSAPDPVPSPIDWAALRRRLASVRGREYWKSLEELADSPAFREGLAREFPRPLAPLPRDLNRRDFITLAGAAMAMAGISGCGRPPAEKIVPYVRQPESIVPGKPLYYATAMPHPGGATGILVRSDMGRPTKIEGNPRHPASLGATDVMAQAAIYSLWDPDRAQSVTRAGLPSTWALFLQELIGALRGPRAKKGEGLAILSEECLSPSIAAQRDRFLKDLPEARWVQYEPMGRESLSLGMTRAFGRDLEPLYRLDQVDVLLCLDADLFATGPGRERYARDYAARRRSARRAEDLPRLYVVESTPSPTGAIADHRFPARSCDIEALAVRLASLLGAGPKPADATDVPPWLTAVADDLRRKPGRGLVVAGRDQSPAVHGLTAALNQHLGNAGRTVSYIDPIPFPSPRESSTLPGLARSIAGGDVKALLILGGNPVYTTPGDLDFARLLSTVPFRAHLSPSFDETARRCHWHLPQTHFLEEWGDALAFDGTASLVQPLIAPLYNGRSLQDVLSAAALDVGRRPYDLVREHWKPSAGAGEFEEFWETALHEGILPGTARPAFAPVLQRPLAGLDGSRSIPSSDLEVVFRPDPSIADGRFAGNPWLQELPKPLTSLTWGNAALISPALARTLTVTNGDVLELSRGGRTVRVPALLLPGHADHSVTVHLGHGRIQAGRIGSGHGASAQPLRSQESPSWATGVTLRKTGVREALATTQLHHSMEGRDPVRQVTAPEFALRPGDVRTREDQPSLYPDLPRENPAWGMVIDLGSCTHCNSCVLACQVENNVPVVGQSQVLASREMHWLRIDDYFSGPPERPLMVSQPVPCMHCEHAPCELVCPVNATSHSREGLNQMTYNRCVGTRYCSNNCPYKVRRFNFFQYADLDTPAAQERYNPDVTVRERGVMEKCTYCIQRISHARIDAEKEGRSIRDGDVKTACQQSCPSQAIVFGNLADPESQVARLKGSPLNYELLGELGTRPRTTYLARVRNPNPRIEGA
jgi:molybdopterin-containing oxidoreductase family iron-sulfur binding subunit